MVRERPAVAGSQHGNRMNFKQVQAQRPDNFIYPVYLNADHVNYIVPSSKSQVGNCIIHMALPREQPMQANKNSTYAVVDDFEALGASFPGLTVAQAFNASSQTTGGPLLVNFDRVLEMTQWEKCVHVVFLDGDEIRIERMPIFD